VNKNQKQIAQSALMAGVVGQVGCATVIVIALSLGAGFLLDRFLDTRPIFTIIFLIGSVPVTLYTIVRVTMTAVNRIQQRLDRQMEEEIKP
jgi:F0F1-type ATP synthase assembly protein I